METYFQPATVADIDLLVGFMRQFYEIDHYPFNEQIALAALDGIISDPSLGRVWIIREGASPVGYMVLTFGYSLEYHGKDAFIDELYIQESHRGRGIGKEAMKFVEEACREVGVNALHLEVERGNRAGQALYRKFGFEGHDRYLMSKLVRR
jgi:GNAT superfamily N-acetyltransferase